MDAAHKTAPPELSEARLSQMRGHLLEEIRPADGKAKTRTRQGTSVIAGRRRMLVVVAVAIAAFYAVPAVAQERWWWLTSPDDPWHPVTQVVTVGQWNVDELLIDDPSQATSAQTTRATAGDQRWLVQAYVNSGGELCLGISPDPPRPANEGAGVGCGFPVRGVNATAFEKERWVGFVAGIPGKVSSSSPKFLYGPAASRVRTVDLANKNNRQIIRVQTHSLPSDLGVDGRFWIVVVPADHLVHMIGPMDNNGEAL